MSNKLPALSKRNKTILVADDDKPVLTVVKTLLETLNYTVIPAQSGPEAIKAYQNDWRAIDLIILDMTMPEMSGDEAFGKIRMINPNVPVLIMSGYAPEENIAKVLSQPKTDFLEKPFKLESFAAKVRKLLD